MQTIMYKDYPREPVPLDNLSIKFMKQAKFVPVSLNNNTIRIAMAKPEDTFTIDALKFAYGLDVEIYEGSEEDILETIERLYGAGSQSLETIIEEAGKDLYVVQKLLCNKPYG